MSKKFKAAITVAAIAGTCAFSSPSFAAWTADAPTKLGTDIVSSVANVNGGLVAVGDDGKAYYMHPNVMVEKDANQIKWRKLTPPAKSDFAGVAYVTDLFFAVTVDGTIVVSANGSDGSWEKSPLSTVLKGLLGDKRIVGIASDSLSKVVMVAEDGSIFYYDNSAQEDLKTIKVIKKSGEDARALAGEPIADNNNVRGIDFLPSQLPKIVVYGAGGGDDSNLYTITFGGSVTSFTLVTCPTINDLAFLSYNNWYAVGDGGIIVKSTDDLSGGGGLLDPNPLDVPGNFSSNLLSIDYNSGEQFGYAAGKAGSLFKVSGTAVTAVNQDRTDQDLNAVSIIVKNGVTRTFVSGDEGASIYGTELYWQPFSGENVGVCPTTPKTVLSLGNKFYALDGDGEKLYSSTNPVDTWKDLQATSPHDLAVSKGVSAAVTTGGYDYVAVAVKAQPMQPSGSMGRFAVFKVKDNEPTVAQGFNTANVDSLDDVNFMAVLDNGGTKNLYLASATANQRVEYVDIASTSEDSSSVAAAAFTSGQTVTGMAASSSALYVVEGANLYVMSTSGDPDGEKTKTEPNAGNGWSKVASGDIGEDKADKLFSTSDGKVICSTTDNQIYLINDAAEVDSIGALDLSYVGGAPVSFSGSSTDLVVATADDIWRYTYSGWKKYGDLDSEVSSMTAVDGVASVGAKVVALDTTNNALAYSGGGVFNVAKPASGPDVGSNILSAYNATKSEVYIAGENGILYKGTKVDSSDSFSFTWTRESDDFLGSKRIQNVTGYDDKLFVTSEVNTAIDAPSVISAKTLGADSWTHLSGNTKGDLVDITALSENGLATIIDGHLVYGKINGDSFDLTVMLTKQGSDSIDGGGFVSVDALGSDLIYAVADKSLYKLANPDANKENWEAEKIELPEAQTLTDVTIIAEDKVYVVGEHGYVAIYDGKNAKKIAAPADVKLTCNWAYDEVLYAGDTNGQVHEYKFKAEEWNSGTVQANINISDIAGSAKGGYLLAVGDDCTAERTEISRSGGGETNTTVHPGHGESADLVLRTVEEDRTPEELTTTNKTPTMEVVGHVETFTTKPGLVVGSVHNFNFSVTPAADTPVADLHLFKLLAANGGSNIEYERQDSIPAAATNGVFWVSDGSGNVMTTSDTLLANTVYTVNFGVKDGGEYDSDGAADGVIIDPVVLGNTGSSSGGSGCVFNPTQTFGMEWLMLAFAPVAAFFRSRFKK